MIKINGETPIVQLNGEPMKDGGNDEKPLTVGRAIASILANGQNAVSVFGSFKAWVKALDFYTKTDIEIDEADLDKLLSLIETDTAYPAILTGQIAQILKKSKEATEKATTAA